MDEIESVDVDQSLLGRMLGYGTIHVLGTGQGIESLPRTADSLAEKCNHRKIVVASEPGEPTAATD